MALLGNFMYRVQKLAKHAGFRARVSKYYDVMALQQAVKNRQRVRGAAYKVLNQWFSTLVA
jgi:hypothetical protein